MPMFGQADTDAMGRAWLFAVGLFGVAVAVVTLAAQWLFSHVGIAIH